MQNPESKTQPNASEVPERLNGESAVDYLTRLQETGQFLFHGSPYGGIVELEPREADDAGGDAWGNDTAVFAVPAVIAVGRAILPPREKLHGDWSITSSRDPKRPGGPLIKVSSNIKLADGVVYVLDKGALFAHPSLQEWKSNNPVQVLAEVQVTPCDYEAMGGNIEIVELD